jgi:dTDP-D-glucose 4,6-dehydratase
MEVWVLKVVYRDYGLRPQSVFSKASSDHFVRAYGETYGFAVCTDLLSTTDLFTFQKN